MGPRERVFNLVSSLYELVKQSGGYKVKNERLLVPSHWMYQEATSEAFNSDRKDIRSDRIYNEEGFIPKINKLIKKHSSEVYSVPIFNKEFVTLIREEIKNIKSRNAFSSNTDDPEEVRIDEFVLNNMCPEWYMTMIHNVIYDFNLIFYFLFGRNVGSGTIQIANYNFGKINKTHWHHDKDSDISMVVPLNTGEYKGGGTDFYNRGSVEPLPNGTGLIFPAFGHVHRGAPVLSGDRYLLVFWLKTVTND